MGGSARVGADVGFLAGQRASFQAEPNDILENRKWEEKSMKRSELRDLIGCHGMITAQVYL